MQLKAFDRVFSLQNLVLLSGIICCIKNIHYRINLWSLLVVSYSFFFSFFSVLCYEKTKLAKAIRFVLPACVLKRKRRKVPRESEQRKRFCNRDLEVFMLLTATE